MEICEGQERGLWLVLENKKPVVAFPSKEQAEQYMPIHVMKREDIPTMEIIHISIRDRDEDFRPLLRRPVRIPSVPPGVTPIPGVVPPFEEIDITKFRETMDKANRSPSYEDYFKPGQVYGPITKWEPPTFGDRVSIDPAWFNNDSPRAS